MALVRDEGTSGTNGRAKQPRLDQRDQADTGAVMANLQACQPGVERGLTPKRSRKESADC